jgi:hypothetical protein
VTQARTSTPAAATVARPRGSLEWTATLIGAFLAALAFGSFAFGTRAPFVWLDPSAAEDLVHLALAAMLLYAGLVRRDPWWSRLAIATTGVFALSAALAGVLGAVPAGTFLTDEDLKWGHAHHLFHFGAAAACLVIVSSNADNSR